MKYAANVPLLLLSALLLAPAPAEASALSDLAGQMKAGEWKELKTPNLGNDTVLYKNVNGEFWYADMATTWSNYLAWNPATQELYWAGAPHLVAFAFLRYSAADNRWYNETNVPECMRLPGYTGCFSHGYDDGTIDPATGTFYFYTTGQIFAYKIAEKKWTSWKQENIGTGQGSALTWFPPLGKLVYVIGIAREEGGLVQVIDPAQRKLDTAGKKLEMGPYHNTMEYSAPLRKLFFGGGNDSRSFYSMDSTRKPVKLPDAPEVLSCNGSSLAADPISGDPLLLATNNSFYAFKAGSNSWVKLASPPEVLNNSSGTIPAMATAIPELGVVFYMSPSLKKVYLYKHSEGGVPVNAAAPAKRTGMRLQQGGDGSLTMLLPPDRGPAGKVRIADLSGRSEADFPAADRIQWRPGKAAPGPRIVTWTENGKAVQSLIAPPVFGRIPSGR